MDSLKVKTLFSWPYLPTHFILGLIVIVSSLSFFLVESSIQWVWYPFVIWGIYIGLLFFFCRIRLSFYRELLQAGITISIMMSLYLLLGYLAFAVIPWNGDRLLSEIDQWLGFGGIPVVTFGHLLSSRIIEGFALIYAAFIPYLYLSIFLYLMNRRDQERALFMCAVTITYALSFTGYLLVPAHGPIIFHQDDFSSPLTGGYFLQLVVDSVARGGGPHGAFPSLHVGASWCLCFFDLRRGQLRGMLYVPLVLGICLATLALRYHYLIDLLAGFSIATFAVFAAEKIYRSPRPVKSIKTNLWRRWLFCYFANIQVQNASHIPQHRPLLVISNHTNAFVDPFILRVALNRPLKLTAKADLMKSPLLAGLLRLFGVITLVRVQDESAHSGRAHNQLAFNQCIDALDRGQAVCLFPEGKSHSSHSMLPFKSGAARLALDFLAISPRADEFCVLPVGLFYDDKERFGSGVCAEVGEPIVLKEWLESRPVDNHRELTQEFTRSIEAVTLNFQDRQSSELLPFVSEIYQRRGKEPEPTDYALHLPEKHLSTTRRFIEEYAALSDRPEVKALEAQAKELRKEMERYKVKIEDLNLPLHPGKVVLFLTREIEMLVLGFVLFTLGFLFNLLPLVFTKFLANKLSYDRDHWATNYLFWGTGLTTISLISTTVIFGITVPALALFWPPLVLFTGYFALRYLQRFRRSLHRVKIFTLFLGRPRLKNELHQQSEKLVQDIEKVMEKISIDSDVEGKSYA